MKDWSFNYNALVPSIRGRDLLHSPSNFVSLCALTLCALGLSGCPFPTGTLSSDDLDGDGVLNDADEIDDDPLRCYDYDEDGCDDCSSGVADEKADGGDLNANGLCDKGGLDPGHPNQVICHGYRLFSDGSPWFPFVIDRDEFVLTYDELVSAGDARAYEIECTVNRLNSARDILLDWCTGTIGGRWEVRFTYSVRNETGQEIYLGRNEASGPCN